MSDRPNVLIIYPDQMRADAMGCDGGSTNHRWLLPPPVIAVTVGGSLPCRASRAARVASLPAATFYE